MYSFLFASPIFSNIAANRQMRKARDAQNYASSWCYPIFDYMTPPDPRNYMRPWGGNNNNNNNTNGSYWNNYWNTNWANGGYWNGNNNGQTSGSTSNGEGTETEKDNVKTCKELLDQIKSYTELSHSQKLTIADALERAKDVKSASEKLEIYKEALKEIGADTINKVLASEPEGDFKGGKYFDELLKAGYEYSSTEVDDELDNLKRVLSKLSDTTGNATESELQGLVDFDAYSKENADHILDIISSWNTKYGKQDNESKRIITLIGDKYLNTEDEQVKEDIKDIMDTYVTALTNKADKVKGNLTGTAKGKLQAAIRNLNDAAADSDTYTSESGIEELSDKFDTLYLLLRQATISIVTANMKDEYGVIGDLIDENVFKENTIDDLKGEGFSAQEIQNTAVKVNKKPATTEDTTVEDQVNELIENGILTEAQVEYNGNKVYQETEKTGSREYQRVFIIKDDDIVELKNATILNDTLVKVDAEKEISESKIAAKTIEKDVNKVLEEKAKNEETQEAGDKPEKPVRNTEFDAELNGEEVGEKLRSWTTKGDTKDINQILGKVNKNNVLDFLKGYYQGEEKLGKTEGLLEHLDDDNEGNNITWDNKKNLVKSVLEKAKALGLDETSDNYKKLKSIFGNYEGKNAKASCKDRTDFDKRKGYLKGQDGKRWGSIAGGATTGAAAGAAAGVWYFGIGAIPGAIVGGVAGVIAGLFDQVTDNEMMDKALEGLYKEMLAKEKEQHIDTEV